MDERGNIWDLVCRLDKINCEIGIQKQGITDLTNLYYTSPARVRDFSIQGKLNFSRSVLIRLRYEGSPEAWRVIEQRYMKSQNDEWMGGY